uniref:RNA helicase n=4 Tax=Meloidogyne TaxID=189290 RepID=A0A915NAU2_MELJA
MTKNVLSDTAYRKLDVDAFDLEKFEDEQGVTGAKLDGEAGANILGPDEAQIRQLLQSNRNLDALKIVLSFNPSQIKNQVLRDKVVQLATRVLTSFKSVEMESTVKALTIDEVDLLMKYIYKGMEQQPDGQTCSSLLAWHAQAFQVCGHGLEWLFAICMAMQNSFGMPPISAGPSHYFGSADEKAIPQAEVSFLNKVLNDKLNQLNEGVPEVSKLQSDPTSPLYSVHSFEDLALKPELIRALRMMGFQQPSKIQEAALPVLLSDPPQDIIAQSQSGTGKTATFLLAMLQRLNPSQKEPQCIVVAPTFELAQQIGDVAKQMAAYLPNVQIRFAVKGESVQNNATKFSEQLIIGTPGKMLDWILRNYIDTSRIIAFALDEADVMISQQGYQDKSILIHNNIIAANPNCQCMLFSATFSDSVFQFAGKLIADPIIITIRRQDQSLPYIRQYYVRSKDREDKYQA